MKKTLILTAMALALIVSGSVVLAQQQGYGPGNAPQGQGWFCPWAGQQYNQNMGPGMMHRGQRMGPGMMHQGWHGQCAGRGMYWQGMGRGQRYTNWNRGQYGPAGGPQQVQPMNQNSAQDLVQNYVAGNPNLKVGSLDEKDGVYEAEIVTKDGSLVERLLIDKETGWMKRVY